MEKKGKSNKRISKLPMTMTGMSILLVLIAIAFTSLAVTPVMAQQAKVTAATTAASEIYEHGPLDVFGNANEDDTIDMRDTTYIKLVIFGKKPETKLADANNDGKVSMLDVGQTKLIILGKEKKLTLIDLADRTVTIDKPVERIVMTFSFEEPIAVDGKDIFKKIVGWNRGYWEGRRQWTWQKYTEKFPEIDDIPDVGYPYKGTFNIEEAVILKPDIVIMSASEYKFDEVWKKLEQAGISIIFVDYHKETIETHAKSTLMLGYVFDKEQRAQEIVDFYTEQIDKVYSRMDEIEGKLKPKVYIEGGYERWRVYDGLTTMGATADKLGAINIAEEGTKAISPEQVLKANPDVIIITGAYWTGRSYLTPKLGYYADSEESREILKRIIDRPGWDTLNAIKNNRVYSIHHGSFRHIYDFYVDQYFAKCFYPDVFEDLDPEENWKEFHERFMPVDYSGVWMLSLEE